MAPPRRRVTYVLPPPPDPRAVPRLQLPPHGAAARRGLPSPLLLTIPMDEFDIFDISLGGSLQEPMIHGDVPINEDDPSRAGVYCVIA